METGFTSKEMQEQSILGDDIVCDYRKKVTYMKRHYLESFLAIANSYESLLRNENEDWNVIGNSTLFMLACFVE